jgi:hypothetical protein
MWSCNSGGGNVTTAQLQIAKGMKRIATLDEALREKQLEQLMVSRETFPDKWLERERERLKQHGEKVDAMLAKQRAEHARK